MTPNALRFRDNLCDDRYSLSRSQKIGPTRILNRIRRLGGSLLTNHTFQCLCFADETPVNGTRAARDERDCVSQH